MPPTAISVANVSKVYRLGSVGSTTLKEDLSRAWARLRGQPDPTLKVGSPHHDRQEGGVFWALDDVSFTVEQGEVLGIIGRNGAGKSTLLKILSRVTAPTRGEIRMRGRVASLLEVGTGFHPDLTGRENVFLNGAILGMRRAEIAAKFAEILAFSGVGEFIDTPVKRYSSGMYVRLAFAVAAHLDPEILILDEVLAVGDAEFQKKCLGKMQQSTREGRTILFVSHNLQAISTLTKNSVLLQDGKCVMYGKTDAFLAKYLSGNAPKLLTYLTNPSGKLPEVVGVRLTTSEPGNFHKQGNPLRLTFDIFTPRTIKGAAFSFKILNSHQQPVVHMCLFDSATPFCRQAGRFRLTCEIPNLRLYWGQYSVTTYLAEAEGGQHFQTLESVCHFEVVMHGKKRDWSWQPGDCQYLEEGAWSVASGVIPDHARSEIGVPIVGPAI